MGYEEMCIAACAKNTNWGKGHSRQAIKKYIAANNNGKCTAGAVGRALKAAMAAGHLAQGSTKARFVATAAGKAAIAPKKK